MYVVRYYSYSLADGKTLAKFGAELNFIEHTFTLYLVVV